MSRATRRAAGPTPLIIAIGSGAGGVGRTTLALELGRAFARRSVRPVLVDCAQTAPIVAAVLGQESPVLCPGQPDLLGRGAHVADFVSRPGGQSPGVLTLLEAVRKPDALLAMDPARLLERLRRLDDDVVVLDLPAGLQPFWSDLMQMSDLPLMVTAPEAWSVRTLVPVLAGLTQRALAMRPDDPVLRTYLVLNGCRDASERDQGEVLCHAIWRKLGHYPRYLGPVDFDDRRWFHLRHGEACPPLSSVEGLGVQVEELAKRILALEDFDERRPRPLGLGGGSAGWMGLSASASAADLRAQYRRLWEGYRRESAVSQVLIGAGERATLISDLERTYRALQMALDDGRVPAHAPASGAPATPPGGERTVTPPEPPPAAAVAAVTRAAPAARAPEPPAAPAEEPLDDRATSCGELLARRRRERDLPLRELSLRTRIGLKYLEAIESMEPESLPPPVYLRGYLREIARILDLPVDSLLDRYLTELADTQKAESSGLGA